MRARLWRWGPLALFAAFVLLALWRLTQPSDDYVRSAMVGRAPPALTLAPALTGRPGIDAHALAPGHAYLINFFASWCVPCQAEAPALAALHARGATIIGIDVGDRPDALVRFLAAHGNPYAAIGADPGATVQVQFGSSGVPESFLVGRDGRIARQIIGDIRMEQVPSVAAELARS